MKSYKTKAIVGTIGMAIVLAISIVSYSAVVVLQESLCQKMGYSAAQFSVFFSMRSVGVLVISFFLGKLITRLGAKLAVIIGSFGPILSFGMLAVSSNVVLLYVVGFLSGALATLPGFVAYNIFVSRWFNQGRGKMMSIGTVVMYIVSIVGVPIIASANATYGVTAACWGVGILFTSISLLCGLLLVCRFPEDYGVAPVDIGKAAPESTDGAAAQQEAPAQGLPAAAYLKLPVTILCMLTPAIIAMGTQMVMAYSVGVYQSFGMDYLNASLCMSISSFGGVFISPIFGILCDKIGVKKSITIYGVLGAAACVLIPLTMHGWAAGISFAILYNLSCYSNMYAGLVMPGLYGRNASPTLIGWTETVKGIIGIFAAPLAMALYGIQESYLPVLIACGIAFFLSVTLNLVVMSPSAKKRIQALEQAREHA